mmetsp:Transcript_54124/g.61945  ORF Transcript_54124/g.61945 Transcript_54124/m.61945 type:complete len:222 (+) Transcript_54124:142-807(+)|eukprot:CAMPEP_0115007256 /NCGR_PEP_ID=MMETSP0216-20121206/21057_1 /TAXON_ID=223996 /ORGANISM="Protocruzia adherens, Strain Boccale" /LENGTH=221 /DNA_ID=CAMNT_0002374135 /DNA_START=139 /DNA_END=804 /DNA_ORIENTATION=-
MKLFGKKKEKQVDSKQQTMDSLKNLKETLEDLEMRQQHITKKIDQQLEEAKTQNRKKNKKAALFALKKKKMYEGEVAKLDGARMTLEQQIFALEGATTQVNVLTSIKQGNKAIKSAYNNISVEEVDKVKDDLEDFKALQDEINDALKTDYEDEDELLDELDELEALEVEEEMLKDVEGVPVNDLSNKEAGKTEVEKSDVPANEEKKEADDDLEALKASMMN